MITTFQRETFLENADNTWRLISENDGDKKKKINEPDRQDKIDIIFSPTENDIVRSP